MTLLQQRVSVSIPPTDLPGDLRLPDRPRGLVIFAHGSGSSRLSPRNQQVAEGLFDVGLASLLFDLLSEDEARDRMNVFDIDLLAERLVQAVDWAHEHAALFDLPIGLFGASTGAAAALKAAALRPRLVSAVVSRGGRPDLAGDALLHVKAPCLLIVGGDDEPVLTWNRQAHSLLGAASELDVIPGATHLFEEPGAMDKVVRRATLWLSGHLNRVR
ncbi:MAG: hypothetical protein RLZZ141_924 [Pseudomonadota bacterium]|jgi:putative phosphoribosyl transferase